MVQEGGPPFTLRIVCKAVTGVGVGWQLRLTLEIQYKGLGCNLAHSSENIGINVHGHDISLPQGPPSTSQWFPVYGDQGTQGEANVVPASINVRSGFQTLEFGSTCSIKF